MNPYRAAFYPAQVEWHGYRNKEDVLRTHAMRAPFYRYWTRGWLPADKTAKCLDLASGLGQLPYFLDGEGYKNWTGVELDSKLVDMAKSAGIPIAHASIQDFLKNTNEIYDCIFMLDILEHFTLEELFDVLSSVAAHMHSGSRLIFSVPNAESPYGFNVRHNDITHELAFTSVSLGEMSRSHGLRLDEIRDPYPAAVDIARSAYRGIATVFRKLEAVRIRACGLAPPKYWCPVIWGMASRI